MKGSIKLDHGEGGAATSRLVRDVFLKHLGGPDTLEDATLVGGADRLALTTDVFVVRPLFFPGGDIGKLSITGTVNDLAAMGARPRYITAGFVIEEGMEIATLERLVQSMARTAADADVRVVAGDTKVVGHGEADGLFISTNGVGIPLCGITLSSASCQVGDAVLLSGPIGDHGSAVMVARGDFEISGEIKSDCRPLWDLAEAALRAAPSTRCMRDPTRGGLATALTEIAESSGVQISITESAIPIQRSTQAICRLLGLDPLYLASEGRLIAVVPQGEVRSALEAMQEISSGQDAALVGRVCEGNGVVFHTAAGGKRPLFPLEGAQLPRIC